MIDMLEAALQYTQELGWEVFPLTSGSKIPLRGSHGVKDATDDAEQVRKWWTEMPDCNIGIATGRGSGILVLDLDGLQAKESVLQYGGGKIPFTPLAQTPGGFHVFFHHPETTVGNKVRMFPGLDLRSDSGYVVGAPSELDSGGTYSWVTTPHDTTLAALPEWVLGGGPVVQDNNKGVCTGRDCGGLLHDGPIPNGARNDTLYRLGSRMLWESRGAMSTQMIEGYLRHEAKRCVTPLSEYELQSLVRSVAKSYRG
jgi:hypothetical protein